MWQTLRKIFSHPELTKKIIFTLSLLIIVRILAHIPLPGVDVKALKEFFSQNELFGLLNMFAGGTIENFSIALMGVSPYITSSIIMQLLTMVIPSLEALGEEGEYGHRKINQYTRILTVPMAFLQSLGMISLLERGVQGFQINIQGITLFEAVIVVTAGTILMMWLGELISELGIGNGISLIITLGIIAGIPGMIKDTATLIFTGGVLDTSKIVSLISFIVVILLTIFVIVFFNEGERRIPVVYARQVRGRRVVGGVETYLPLRPAQAGVIPIIFALSILLFPSSVAQFLKTAHSEKVVNIAEHLGAFFANDLYYTLIYFILTFAFTFFYTSIIFNTQKIAENLQKHGGYIPGIRPGLETKNYLSGVTYKICSLGGFFLGIIAILPFLLTKFTGLTTIAIGGTGLLIMVSVVLETVDQFRAMLLMRQYEE